jgi:hypothetical protein
MATAGIDGLITQPLPVPHKLATSCQIHLEVLSAVTTGCQRYNSPLLAEVRDLLKFCYTRIVDGIYSTKSISASVLMLYRWKGRGTGIIPMNQSAALEQWTFFQSTEEHIHDYLIRPTEQARSAIEEVCSPGSRICEEGYFDFSILIH